MVLVNGDRPRAHARSRLAEIRGRSAAQLRTGADPRVPRCIVALRPGEPDSEVAAMVAMGLAVPYPDRGAYKPPRCGHRDRTNRAKGRDRPRASGMDRHGHGSVNYMTEALSGIEAGMQTEELRKSTLAMARSDFTCQMLVCHILALLL